LNLTEDSFSDGSQYLNLKNACEHGKKMLQEGARIIDFGAESTRPGAKPVALEVEKDRCLHFLKQWHETRVGPSSMLSLDTTKPEVAEVCLENYENVAIINDVSGLKESGKRMAELAKSFKTGLVLMHRRGDAQTMQACCNYKDLISEVKNELAKQIDFALSCGINSDQIVIDPGIGFAKTAEQSIELLQHVEAFAEFKRPILIGHSRKSFFNVLTGKEVQERDGATALVTALLAEKGVHIFRIHDVAGSRDAIQVARAIGGRNHVRSFQMA